LYRHNGTLLGRLENESNCLCRSSLLIASLAMDVWMGMSRWGEEWLREGDVGRSFGGLPPVLQVDRHASFGETRVSRCRFWYQELPSRNSDKNETPKVKKEAVIFAPQPSLSDHQCM